jgi:peptidoglycan/LPS O-acetylase OafA/YrhL
VYTAVLLAGAINMHNADAIVSIATSALLLEVGRAGKLYDWLNGWMLQFLGKISYSLYLLHGPITAVTLRYTLYSLTPRTAAWELFWLVVVLATNCIGAFLFWRLVEKPFMLLARRCRPSAQRASHGEL